MKKNTCFEYLVNLNTEYKVNGVTYIVESVFLPDGFGSLTLKEKFIRLLSNECSGLTLTDNYVTMTDGYVCSTAGKED